MSVSSLYNNHPLPSGKRVLLLNSPAYDLRLPWYRWHQPSGLLQLGATLRHRGCDVKFADFLVWGKSSRAPKSKERTIILPDAPEINNIHLWRFGASDKEIQKLLEDIGHSWSPEIVFVSCAMTTWWLGAQKLIQLVTAQWPEAGIILGGSYPTYAQDHAERYSGAHQLVVGPVADSSNEYADLTLYSLQQKPKFTGIFLYKYTGEEIVPRPPEEIAAELQQKAAIGVTTFTFFDDEIRLEHQNHFIQTLELIDKLKLDKVGLIITGNLSPRLINGKLAQRLKSAKCRQIYLRCDVSFGTNGMKYVTPNEIYAEGVEALHKDGDYIPRTDQITAMFMVGAPYEQIEDVTERLIRLASIVGSVNLVQYQYSPNNPLYKDLVQWDIDDKDTLTQLNCKLYPLGRATGIPFTQYLELTRLAALLNSKYRSTTFDFLGESLTAQLMRNSLRTQGWVPGSTTPKEGLPQNEIIPLLPVDHGEK